jgi:acyl-CoA thioesterase-2
MDFAEMIHLEPHGADVLVGSGPRYPWGGLYGGQIVAQALRAAASTVDAAFAPHSLRAYFIRAGDHEEPVRYEVDRIRNGGSFCTRRVVARQAVGAILNLEASFHRGEDSMAVQTIAFDPSTPGPDGLVEDSWTKAFERRFVPEPDDSGGRARCWFRMPSPVAPITDDPLLHATALAYISDDLPTDAVTRAMALGREAFDGGWFSVSLDHAIWFHQPVRADEWHLQDFSCHAFHDGRGLAIGHVFTLDGTHAATIAQEVLVRPRRIDAGK